MNIKIASYFLAFVVLWFGLNEIISPASWTVFVPKFLGALSEPAVVGHGIILSLCGLALIFNFKRQIAAGIIALLLIGIIITLISMNGLSAVAVRDIGLFGLALSLAWPSTRVQNLQSNSV